MDNHSANTPGIEGEDADVLALCGKCLEKPLSEKSEKLLHTDQSVWTINDNVKQL